MVNSAIEQQSLPQAFDAESYRRVNADLAELSEAELRWHYETYGEREGRQANALATRADFAALIGPDVEALEIGPFWNPLLRGARTMYFDVLTRAAMIERAITLGVPDPPVPEIDFVSASGDLSVIDRDFDCVLSSHSIEHQPDLIRHLQSVGSLLRPGGRYFVLVPDKRYCFDHFIGPSTLADVLDAADQRRSVHTLKSLIEHRVLTTHNDVVRHWDGDHGAYMDDRDRRLKIALQEYEAAHGSYIDVHAWTFTPQTATIILRALSENKFIDLELERLYPTRVRSNEFWLVLKKLSAAGDPSRSPSA